MALSGISMQSVWPMACAFSSPSGAATTSRERRGAAAVVAPVASASALSAAGRSCSAEASA